MKIEIESKYNTGDKVKAKRDDVWHECIVIDLKFISNVNHSKFYYLIEFPNRTRSWISEDFVEQKEPREY